MEGFESKLDKVYLMIRVMNMILINMIVEGVESKLDKGIPVVPK